ncbi:peptidoglycan/LPS O-acetylase OafA/YrhL [Pseudomonas sp. Tn43]|uniref:acyltransferase family protein n=1 Tax=Pseudomonas sp. Tn43 TaxID=701213 RepID=UPI001614145E|nr:acyltransferase [Pseudomonas sp. Tn43]MBB3239017.1 peptidoglycan/LPS O-acetylase OafA/YrhL [Pseudomonas sp. Tn43]
MTVIAALLLLYTLSIALLNKLFSYSTLLTQQILDRSSPLDALRGILATSVVCHHFITTYYWKTTGVWSRPDSDLLNNLGAVPVSLFFMITGFLFLGKIYESHPNWAKLLSSRVRRIMPLYLFVFAALILTTLIKTEFKFVHLGLLAKETLKWLIFFGASFNGFQDSIRMTAGAHWTLGYEWIFYLTLPLIAILFRKNGPRAYLLLSLLTLTLVALGFYSNLIKPSLFQLFFIGFIPILIKKHLSHAVPLLQGKGAAFIATILIAVSLFQHEEYSTLQMLFLAIPFAIISLGNDIFGLLKNRGLKSLGEVSYSIYLTHGLILYWAFSTFNIFDFSKAEVFKFIALLPVVLIVVSGTSVITYLFIEKPFMSSNKNRTKPISQSLSTAKPTNI